MVDALKLTYGQVELLVAARLAVDDTRTGALTSRLKALRRQDIPIGSAVGTGVRFAYGLEHVLQIVIAFELMENLFMPQQAAATIHAEWPMLRRECAVILGSLRYERGAVANRVRPADGSLLAVTATAQSKWTQPAEAEEQQWRRLERPGTVSITDPMRLQRALAGAGIDAETHSVILIDLWSVVARLADSLVGTDWATPATLRLA